MKFFKSFVALLLFYSVALNAMDFRDFSQIIVTSDQGIKVTFSFRCDDDHSDCIVCTVELKRVGDQSTQTREIKFDINSCCAIFDQFKPQELLTRNQSRQDCGLCLRREIIGGVLFFLVGVVLVVADYFIYKNSVGLSQVTIGISVFYWLLFFIGYPTYCICCSSRGDEERRSLLDEEQSLYENTFFIKKDLLQRAREKLQELKIVVKENGDQLICSLKDGDTYVVQVQ